jgi:hypothetical protein
LDFCLTQPVEPTLAALWATSPTTPDPPPNDAFVKDAPEISDKRLDSRGITIASASAQLSFRNNFNLQDAFDGGVLEVSSPNIAGGCCAVVGLSATDARDATRRDDDPPPI